MSITTAKRRPLKKSQREELIRWLEFYDEWLWQMGVTPQNSVQRPGEGTAKIAVAWFLEA